MTTENNTNSTRIQAYQQQLIDELFSNFKSGTIIAKKITENLRNSPDLKIQKGKRVIYGKTSRGVREDLNAEDLQNISSLTQSRPKADKYQVSKEPNYEIKVGDEIILRQERTGDVSVNKFWSRSNLKEPNSQDIDRDGLRNTEEVKKNTDPLKWDTDGDGRSDQNDDNPTVVSSLKTSSISNTLNLIEKDAENLPLGKAVRELLKSIAHEIKSKVTQLVKKAGSIAEAFQKKLVEQDVANTAIKLQQDNWLHNRGNNYESESYNISSNGQHYLISDKQNNVLMRFERTAFGTKINENNFSSAHYQDFKGASIALKSQSNLHSKNSLLSSQLGNLAPVGDRAINREIQVLNVVNTAKTFLHYMDTKQWNGKYNLTLEGNSLKIESPDGRGRILEINKDRTVSDKLNLKDLEHFEKLNAQISSKIQEIQAQKQSQKSQAKVQTQQRELTKG